MYITYVLQNIGNFIISYLIFMIIFIFGITWILYLLFLLILWIYDKIRNFVIRRRNIKIYRRLLNTHYQTYNSNENEVCCICLCDYSIDNFVSILPCEHKYHDSCIRVWFDVKTICPLCNTKLGLNEIIIV